MDATGTIRLGIGGWTFAPWRGSFYPEGLAQKRELEFASRQLGTIEINGTYYGSQKPESFSRWHDETPEDFVFSLKAPRFATNRRELAAAGESIERFFASGLMRLGDKLGPINWQFMATKKFDPADFEAFLKLLPTSVEGRNIRHAVEVRHESFATAEFVQLARTYGVAVVLSGDSTHPQISDVTAPFVYVRIMGTQASEAAGYSEAGLDAWAERARVLSAGGLPDDLASVGNAPTLEQAPRDVFLYVIGGEKVLNPATARALIDRLG